MTGTLRTGIVAIGGETTGTTLTTKDGTRELEFGNNQKLRSLAGKLNGKQVLVSGLHQSRKGVEIKRREIITVKTLVPAK